MESVDAHREIDVGARALTQSCPGIGQSPMELLHLRPTHRDPKRCAMDSAVLEDQPPCLLANQSGGEQGVESLGIDLADHESGGLLPCEGGSGQGLVGIVRRLGRIHCAADSRQEELVHIVVLDVIQGHQGIERKVPSFFWLRLERVARSRTSSMARPGLPSPWEMASARLGSRLSVWRSSVRISPSDMRDSSTRMAPRRSMERTRAAKVDPRRWPRRRALR